MRSGALQTLTCFAADGQEAEVEHSMAEHTGKKKVVCRLIHQMSKR